MINEQAVHEAAVALYGWECSPYLGRFVFDELPEHTKNTKLFDARLVVETYLKAARSLEQGEPHE